MILSNDNRYKGEVGRSLRLDERSHVEEPFLQQLEDSGWQVLRLDNRQEPQDSFRNNFSEVALTPEIRRSLKKINPFLTEGQLDEVVRKITTFDRYNLIENNKKVWELLLENTTVSRNETTGEISPTVRYIDFDLDKLDSNSFLAISQFKIKVPGTEHHIIPDIVLFVNGLPLVVVECKSPKIKEPIAEAIDQLMRYSEQRNEGREGNQELFYYNHFLVTTCRQQAKFGTITTHIEKRFYRWTDPYPYTLNDLEHSGTSPNDQQRLIAGMLDKRNFLDLLRNFTIFGADDKGKTIKIVGRYQQFRAVKLAVKRLLEGRNPGERSGIIWHTQGSGKSLTMMFMVREMRRHLHLQSWKVVFITDRTQLEQQLSETSQGIGFTVKVSESINPRPDRPGKSLKELIASPAPDLVMAMIHKFQESEIREIFPVLNTSPNILVMTDEAHRTQYKLLGANLRRAIPNATHIAYTGTPIDLTEDTFGDYIDKYTMRQSIDDGVTLNIVYEGRTHNAEISDTEAMDVRFEDVFSDYNLRERLQILGYGSREAYLEAGETIRAKAADLIRHYVNYVLPNGFKAQVVAVSREAAIRYKKYIDAELEKVIADLEQRNPNRIDLDRLKKLETAVVISGSHNDPPSYQPFTNPGYHKTSINRFKMAFDRTEEGIDGNVGIIIVNEMLLTGFDAPVEQVLYLDKVITDHNLLQAIARVNRVAAEGKEVGYVNDYVGIGHHLKKALDKYAERELNEIVETLGNSEQQLNELIAAHRAIWGFLEKHKCTDFGDPDAFFDLFYDEDIRFEYILLFKRLTSAFNKVLPRKEALDYFKDYQNFLEINNLASRHFRDSRLSMKGIPAKLRGIADEFLRSKGIELKISPISILDEKFIEEVSARKRIKTRAAEIEHAIRHYIDLNLDEDPELFASFSRMLEEILRDFKGNWQRIYEELEKLRQRIKDREREETYGLDRKRQMPLFRVIRSKLFEGRELTEEYVSRLVNLTQHIFNLLRVELNTIGFWESIPPQNRLKAELQRLLLSEDFIKLPGMTGKYSEMVTGIMEIARTHHHLIIKD